MAVVALGGVDIEKKDDGSASANEAMALDRSTEINVKSSLQIEDKTEAEDKNKKESSTNTSFDISTNIPASEIQTTPNPDETVEGYQQPLKDYSSFGSKQKKWIVFAATLGAFFSPFTAQIYFPALTSIAADLKVSDSKVNLTMTTYMVGLPLGNIAPYSPTISLAHKRDPRAVTVEDEVVCY
jgi:hypothetical protein